MIPKGTLVVCSRDMLGILTAEEPQSVSYPDGGKGMAYVGINVENGEPWCSRDPAIVGTMRELAESGLSLRDWICSKQPLMTKGFVFAPHIPDALKEESE